MRFVPTPISGVTVIAYEPVRDDRGTFAALFHAENFARAGIGFQPTQTHLSTNAARHTLRGLHYQAAPHAETKLVQCIRGRMFDVALDLRPESPTFRRWHGVELAPDRPCMLLIPKGCAHGYMTLEPDTEVYYVMDSAYVPAAARGVRWNDPAFNITWPATPACLAQRDATYPDFTG